MSRIGRMPVPIPSGVDVTIDGREVTVSGWRGTVGRNWGSEHADTWVWLHAADFGATQMRPIASDLTAGGPELTVDWMRMSPYPASGRDSTQPFRPDSAVAKTR